VGGDAPGKNKEEMAMRKEVLQKAEELRPLFEWAGREWGFAPALLAAIAVRESECGLGLDDDFLGDNGHGHGIMQVDDGSFGGLFVEGYPRFWTDPMWSIATGAAILDSKWRYLEKNTPLKDRKLTWAAVAAYNCGEGRVAKLAAQLLEHDVEDEEFRRIADTHTANHDYVRQVWRDAQEFVKLGWSGAVPGETEEAAPEQPEKSGAPKPQTKPPETSRPAQPVEVQPQTYSVQPGDTLSMISKKLYGDPGLYQKLAYYNGICNPDVIQVGQILEVPGKSELLGEPETAPVPGAAPARPAVKIEKPKLGMVPPHGLEAIFSFFGDIRDYLYDDGTLDEASWIAEYLGQAALPFPIPLSWDLGTTVKRVRCHKKLVDILPEVLAAIEKAGLRKQIKNYGGCFAFRSKRTSGRLSTHSWGIAIDLNPLTNPMGLPGDMNPDVVEIFRQFGFKWGGDWPGRNQDPMHFQFCTGY
jgi:LysM repeat protein